MDTDLKQPDFSTLAVRAGHRRTGEGEHAEAIFTTSSFVFQSAAEAAARFSGDRPGNVYSRFTNPTVAAFQERLAALEGGESCVATASGMSAILAICMSQLKSGDHIVASGRLFGSTVSLFNTCLQRFGVQISYVALSDYDAWERACNERTRMLFLETPSNPLTELADIQILSALARRKDLLLVVDNCFCTPALQRPLALGADLVVHSATKFLDGQGRCVGGAVVGDRKRVGQDLFGFLRTAGPSLSPFNAWVFLKGLETLEIRMQAHCRSALGLAQWLVQQPQVNHVYYPGLTEHPQHALARRQQSGYGGIVSFDLDGGREAAWNLIDRCKLLSITANLGDTKSTITHPATTTHGRMTQPERDQAGIGEGLVRISVGLESLVDIQLDLERGLRH